MTISTAVGLIKKGLDAEKPTFSAYLTEYLYYATDTGNLYYYDASSRVLLQGSDKVEILKNKSFDFSLNTVIGLVQDPFQSNKRVGLLIPSLSAVSSVQLALKGLPSIGTYSLFYDSIEKYVCRFSTSSVIQIGYQSNGTTAFATRRSLNPRLKVRCRTSDANATFMYIGFSTKLPTPNGGFPIDATASGVFVGLNNTIANYFVRNGDGANFNNVNTATPRDSIFRTFEIIMSATNIITKIDAVTVNTATTFLQGLNTDVYMFIELHNRSGTNNLDISKVFFQDDSI